MNSKGQTGNGGDKSWRKQKVLMREGEKTQGSQSFMERKKQGGGERKKITRKGTWKEERRSGDPKTRVLRTGQE